MKDESDYSELVISRCACRKGSDAFDHVWCYYWRVELPRLVATEKEVAIVALQITALANLEYDIQVLCWFDLHEEFVAGLPVALRAKTQNGIMGQAAHAPPPATGTVALGGGGRNAYATSAFTRWSVSGRSRFAELYVQAESSAR